MTAPAVSTSKSWSGSALQFSILKECMKSKCRTAKLTLPHHTLETPTFMPVGTKGTMKGLLPEQVIAAGADIILGNTYHLGTQPGQDTMLKAGGLHKWMKWPRGLLTDSGGFQMVSLLKLAKITEEGVTFKSPYDGSECVLTPEESIRIQNAIGADIMMQLDDVVDVRETNYERFKEATLRTTRWLDRCIAANSNPKTQNLFPIVQGGLFPDLRELSLQQLLERDAPGYAIGGLCGGEEKPQFWSTIHQCTDKLPLAKPRYCMGVGFAPDLVVCVALGVDMFDCVYPTRTARFGCALVDSGQVSMKSVRFAQDFTPIDASCSCSTCAHYTRAYLHTAATHKAAVACHLLSVHNIAYQMRLMSRIRESVKEDRFPEFVEEFLTDYYGDLQAVPEWIRDALAAVNITLHKSDPGNEASFADERAHHAQQKPKTKLLSNIVEFDDLPVQTASLTNENVSVNESGAKSQLTDAWDMDDDEEAECEELSGRGTECVLSDFETRAFDLGYREALRQDYPDEEERGRVAGFADAMRMLSSFRTNGVATAGGVDSTTKAACVGSTLKSRCRDDGMSSRMHLEGEVSLVCDSQVNTENKPGDVELDRNCVKSCEKELCSENTENKPGDVELDRNCVKSCEKELCSVNISCNAEEDACSSLKQDTVLVQNPIYVLSILEGSLSLMLLRCQSVMSDDHLREVVSIKECIKKQLQKINTSFDTPCEHSLNVAFGGQFNCSNVIISGKTQFDSCKPAKLDKQGCANSCVEHALIAEVPNPLTEVHEQVRSLLGRIKSVCYHYQWMMPSCIAS